MQHVKREKDIMAECQNPFLVNLQGSFQDQENLYLVMETVMGGELFYYLQAHKGPLSESCAPTQRTRKKHKKHAAAAATPRRLGERRRRRRGSD